MDVDVAEGVAVGVRVTDGVGVGVLVAPGLVVGVDVGVGVDVKVGVDAGVPDAVRSARCEAQSLANTSVGESMAATPFTYSATVSPTCMPGNV